MTGDEYQILAGRTINNNLTFTGQEHQALCGMCGEVGELHSLYQKTYQGHKFEEEDAKKKLGDLLWFIAEYCTAMHWRLNDIMDLNIEKLRDGYPDGFDDWYRLHSTDANSCSRS